MRRAVLANPQGVLVEARLLVIEVTMVAEDHPDRRVNDLGGDAIAILIGHARVGIPSAAMHLLELCANRLELAGVFASRCRQRDVDRAWKILDQKNVAELLVMNHVRGGVFVLRVDPVHVGTGRFGDMGIGGDNWFLHRLNLDWLRLRARNPDREFTTLCDFLFTRRCRRLQCWRSLCPRPRARPVKCPKG